MKTSELIRRILHWTDATTKLDWVVDSTPGYYEIHAEVRTTMTRASSLVTRIGLLVDEIVDGSAHQVGKVLLSELPATRASLATWKLFVRIPIKRRTKRA